MVLPAVETFRRGFPMLEDTLQGIQVGFWGASARPWIPQISHLKRPPRGPGPASEMGWFAPPISNSWCYLMLDFEVIKLDWQNGIDWNVQPETSHIPMGEWSKGWSCSVSSLLHGDSLRWMDIHQDGFLHEIQTEAVDFWGSQAMFEPFSSHLLKTGFAESIPWYLILFPSTKGFQGCPQHPRYMWGTLDKLKMENDPFAPQKKCACDSTIPRWRVTHRWSMLPVPPRAWKESFHKPSFFSLSWVC